MTDPENEELLKLKSDLEEVIELTRDLIKTQEGESKVHNIHSSSNNDDVAASLLAEDDNEYVEKPNSKWHPGEKCLAKWKTDGVYVPLFYLNYTYNTILCGLFSNWWIILSIIVHGVINILNFRYYEATIEEVYENNLKVRFDGYLKSEIISILDIKAMASGSKRPLSGDESK